MQTDKASSAEPFQSTSGVPEEHTQSPKQAGWNRILRSRGLSPTRATAVETAYENTSRGPTALDGKNHKKILAAAANRVLPASKQVSWQDVGDVLAAISERKQAEIDELELISGGQGPRKKRATESSLASGVENSEFEERGRSQTRPESGSQVRETDPVASGKSISLSDSEDSSPLSGLDISEQEQGQSSSKKKQQRPELSPRSRDLKKKLGLSDDWETSRRAARQKSKVALAVAEYLETHPGASYDEVNSAAEEQGFSVGKTTFTRWNASKRKMKKAIGPELLVPQELINLKETLGLTDAVLNAKKPEEAIDILRYSSENPYASRSDIIDAMAGIGITVSSSTLDNWGVANSKDRGFSPDRLDLQRRLELSDDWFKAARRKGGQIPLEVAQYKIDNPEATRPQIIEEMKNRGMDVGLRTLARWKI